MVLFAILSSPKLGSNEARYEDAFDARGGHAEGKGHLKSVTLADVNGDSWLDAIEVSRKRLRVFLNRSERFVLVFSTLRYGSAVAAGDVNGDDRVDPGWIST